MSDNFDTPYDEKLKKIIKAWKIPDFEGGEFGTLVQIYKYDKNPIKMKLLRYGVDRKKNDEEYTNPNVNIAQPEAIRKVAQLMMLIADEKETVESSTPSFDTISTDNMVPSATDNDMPF